MIKSFAALAVLAVTLQGVLSFEFLGIDFGRTFDKISGVQRFRRGVGDGKPCTWGSFEKVFQCCTFPPVVPDGSLKSCISSTLKKKRKVGETNITEEGECKLSNLHILYCLFREVSMNCPSSSVPEAAENCDSKVSNIESCDPWSVMKDVESKVDSSLKTASTFLKNNNPFANFAARFKNISSKSVVEKADKLRQTATGHVEKMVQSAKTGGKSLADSGKSLADTGKNLAGKAKQFFAKVKESVNN